MYCNPPVFACQVVTRYLREVLERIAHHPINRIDQLLPWNLGVPQLDLSSSQVSMFITHVDT